MIDFRALVDAVNEAVAIGLGEGAETVARAARAKAPVRRVFSNRGPVTRAKTAAEMEAGKSIRAALGLSVEGSRANPSPRVVVASRAPRRWHDRRLSQAGQLLADRDAVVARMQSGRDPRTPRRLREFHAAQVPWRTALSARGGYEVRTRRAVGTFDSGRRTIGGTLRASITAEVPIRQGGRSVAWVIASAPYAKFQEFGTRHNAAQPFLRPAAEESRSQVADLIGARVAQASRTRLGKYEIEVVVPI